MKTHGNINLGYVPCIHTHRSEARVAPTVPAGELLLSGRSGMQSMQISGRTGKANMTFLYK